MNYPGFQLNKISDLTGAYLPFWPKNSNATILMFGVSNSSIPCSLLTPWHYYHRRLRTWRENCEGSGENGSDWKIWGFQDPSPTLPRTRRPALPPPNTRLHRKPRPPPYQGSSPSRLPRRPRQSRPPPPQQLPTVPRGPALVTRALTGPSVIPLHPSSCEICLFFNCMK